MIDERAILNSLKIDLLEELETLFLQGYPISPREINSAQSKVWWKYKKIETSPILMVFDLIPLLDRAAAELETEGALERFRAPAEVLA